MSKAAIVVFAGLEGHTESVRVVNALEIPQECKDAGYPLSEAQKVSRKIFPLLI